LAGSANFTYNGSGLTFLNTGNFTAITAQTSSSTPADGATFNFTKTGYYTSTIGSSQPGTIVFNDKTGNNTAVTSAKIYNTNLVGNTVPADLTSTILLDTYSTTVNAITGDSVSSFRIGGSNGGAKFIFYGYNPTTTTGEQLLQVDYLRVMPGTDNYLPLGVSSKRWTTVYATNGTINTSDRNEKQDIEELSAAEQRVAVRIKGLIRKYRFKDSVVEKGDGARIHVGVIAQDVQDAFTAEGLDATRYGMFCSDTYKVLNGKPVEKNQLGEYPEGAVDHTRLGVRYDQLLAFVISVV
jgi:hypothetical protein